MYIEDNVACSGKMSMSNETFVLFNKILEIVLWSVVLTFMSVLHSVTKSPSSMRRSFVLSEIWIKPAVNKNALVIANNMYHYDPVMSVKYSVCSVNACSHGQ